MLVFGSVVNHVLVMFDYTVFNIIFGVTQYTFLLFKIETCKRKYSYQVTNSAVMAKWY